MASTATLMLCVLIAVLIDGQKPSLLSAAKSLQALTPMRPRTTFATRNVEPHIGAAAPALAADQLWTSSSTSSRNSNSGRPTVEPDDDHQPQKQILSNADDVIEGLRMAVALPDHLEGVRIERDGQLNHDFRKEVLLGVDQGGKDMDDVVVSASASQLRSDSTGIRRKFGPKADHDEQLLTKVFHKADVNKDRTLTVAELSSWIASKVNDHLDKAIKSNFNIFMTIDKDHNGLVTWDEYHRRYLMDRGYDTKYIDGHSEKHKDMPREMREEILLDSAGFAEAARTNEEGLNIDEFLSFRHPEHSHATLLNMANDIFDKLDENGDDFLNVAEFVSLNQDDDVNRRSPRMSHEMWMTEREREFIEVIDANKDGKVTRHELVMYSDPKNPSHALMEAKSLVDAADTNRDNKLTLAEVIANKDLFLGSKMVDISKKIHDEF